MIGNKSLLAISTECHFVAKITCEERKQTDSRFGDSFFNRENFNIAIKLSPFFILQNESEILQIQEN